MVDFFSSPFIAVIVLLGLLIFVHELGHFIVGKLCGIGVEVFSIGFGPKLFSFIHNDTEYRLALLPLGGFVKFSGALPSEPVPEPFKGKEMYLAPLWARGLAIIAGPIANLLLAVSIYSVLGWQGIEHPPAVVGQVMPGSAAEIAGLFSGDKILAVDGKPISKWEEFRDIVSESAQKKLSLTIQRFDETIQVDLVPEKVMAKNIFGNLLEQGRAGIGPGFVPSIVTLVSETSLAARAGLKTGDQIDGIRILGENKENLIDNQNIRTWHEFLSMLQRAVGGGAKSIELNITEENKSKKTAVIDLPPLPESKAKLSNLAEHESYARLIGLTHSVLTVGKVESPASEALLPHDVILKLNDKPIESIYDLYGVLQDNQSSTLKADVRRDSSVVTLEIPLEAHEIQKPEGKSTYYKLNAEFLGSLVHPPPFVEIYKNPLMALWYGIKTTAEGSTLIVSTIGGLLSGKVPVQVLGGPILIAKMAGESAKRGLETFFNSMAIISINLGIINLFPIPVLDGGQLLLVIAQGFRRRQLSEMAIENFQKIGFVMVLALIVLATYNDLSRFWASMVKSMLGFLE